LAVKNCATVKAYEIDESDYCECETATTENPAGIFFLTEAWTFSTPTLRREPSNHVSHQ